MDPVGLTLMNNQEQWDSMRTKLVSEMLCLPLPSGGRALVEIHLQQRILADDPVLYSRKRRVQHTFFVRDRDQIIKFEVSARASVVPATTKGRLYATKAAKR